MKRGRRNASFLYMITKRNVSFLFRVLANLTFIFIETTKQRYVYQNLLLFL